MLPVFFYLFSPLRFPYYYPFTVDPPAFAFYAISAFFLVKGNFLGSIISLTLSCFFRESGVYFAILIALAVIFINGENKQRSIRLIPMLLISLSGILITNVIQEGGCSGSQFTVILSSVRGKLTDPFGILKFLAGISITLAPFFIGSNLKELVSFDKNDLIKRISGMTLVLSLVMAAAGGSDTTRILYISYPLYVVYLAGIVEKKNWLLVIFISVGGLIANHFLTRLPEPQNYIPENDISGLFSFFPDHGQIVIAIGFLVYWALLSWIVKVLDWEMMTNNLFKLNGTLCQIHQNFLKFCQSISK